MAVETDDYLAVLKASYDYEPQSEDELAIKENQILFLKERVDDDWWKVKIKGDSQEDDSPIGLVPAAYVEPADHSAIVKVLYDYESNSPGELSVKEDEVLHVFDTEDDWLLVQSQKEGGKAGFVPANYVEPLGDDDEPDPPPAPRIVIPSTPPRPVSAYIDPADRVATSRVKADDIQTWSVVEVDKKGKKKKGTLGIGNGAVFFASESDKTPVQKWQTVDVESTSIEKSKHVLIEIGGSFAISLHFNVGSKDNADAIVAKLQSSKQLSAPSPPTSPQKDDHEEDNSPPSRSEIDASRSPKKSGASVHFSPAPAIIPPRGPSEDGDEDDVSENNVNGAAVSEDVDDVALALALYDFTADGEDELSVAEGDRLVVLERDSDEWWKCRNAKGIEGVVPASYLDISGSISSHAAAAPVEDDINDYKAQEAEKQAEMERLEKQRVEEERQEQERKKEADQRAKAAAAAAEAQRIRRKGEAARVETAKKSVKVSQELQSSDKKKKPGANGESSSSSRASADNGRPSPERIRVWHDRSGQFRVEAAFLGFSNGKLRLHKVNGVIVEVPSEKMSVEDMRYVEKMTAKRAKPAPTTRVSDDDDVPLALQRDPLHTTARIAPPPKQGPKIDWFDFFLSAGCDVDDCTRYASSFERDKIDESVLPDITDATMRSLGLREGDIIRVTKAIEKRKPVDKKLGTRVDDETTKKLQGEEGTDASRNTSSPGPPNLFAGPGGALKQPRRKRPQPSKSLPPPSVDINAIATASDQLQRTSTSSPQISSPATKAPASLAPIQPPPRSSSALIPSGFDDDAWTNRPSSTRPIAPTPPIATPRPPSAPVASAASAPPSQSATQSPQSQISPAAAQNTGGQLAKTTEADIFAQLSRLSELRKTPVITPSPPVSTSPSILSPSAVPVSYQSGLGMGSSPIPMGQMQNQAAISPQTAQGPSFNGPRGPFAPVPANQSLLQPLIPTQTGFNSFVPTRSNGASPFQPPSFIPQQPTGFMAPSQPLMSQPTGMPFNGFNQAGSFQGNGFGQVQSNPTGFNPSFGQVQSNPTGFNGFAQIQSTLTGFNPGFGQSSFSAISAPPVPPLPASGSNITSPANIFAQMKSGTFATGNDDRSPQPSDKYDSLRPNPLTAQATGWNGYQGGYNGFQR